jgi:hypothetical protein
MTGPLQPEPVRAAPPARPFPLASILIALLPVWLFLVLLVIAPSFVNAIYLDPPAMLGVPFGVVLVAAGLAWCLLGAIVIATSSSNAIRLIASVVFTLPAMFVVILGPAVARILSNLAGAD